MVIEPRCHVKPPIATVEDVRDEHVKTCTVDTWLKTYTPRASEWSQVFINSIMDALQTATPRPGAPRYGQHLDCKGWIDIRGGIKKNLSTKRIYMPLQGIASRIASAAIAINPDLERQRRFTCVAYSKKKTQSEVPGPLPRRLHWRTVRRRCPESDDDEDSQSTTGGCSRSADSRLPNDDLECHNTSDITSDIAVIGTFNIVNAFGVAGDVSIFP